MRSTSDQFYAQLREAMFANKMTASDISANQGVHYTYIYNSIRKNANVTLSTAQKLAEASGYEIELTFKPIAGTGVAELVGNMDPKGPLYTERRIKSKATTEVVASGDPTTRLTVNVNDDGKVTGVSLNPQEALDAEIDALLADGNA